MSTELEKVNQELSTHSDQLTRLLHAVPTMTEEGDVQEVRARVEAARAWAKAHKRLKEVRLELLLLEIRALVRAWELGATTLTPRESDVAEEYSHMSEQQIRGMISSFGSATTAAGLMSAARKKDKDAQRYADEVKGWTDGFTSNRPYPFQNEPASLGVFEYRYAQGLAQVLAETLDANTEDGEAFTIEDVVVGVETLLEIEPSDYDPAIREGLKEVARSAVRKPHLETWNGTKIPRFITTILPRTDGEHVEYVRLPVMNAKIRDLQTMIGIREEQLRQDKAALKRLQDFHTQLCQEPDVDKDSNIGDILVASVQEVAA